MKLLTNNAFTVVELMLTIAIMGIISTFTFSFYTRFLTQNALSNTVDQMAGSLRKAQTYSMAGKQESNWGVNYSSNKITLFKGTSIGQDPAFNEVYDTSPNIAISGFTEIYFNRVTGLPSTIAAITITGNSETKTITINEQGVVNKQ